jgi:hypothetical protein
MVRKPQLIVGLLLICVAGVLPVAYAQKHDGFSRFYAEFQSAVKADDKEKVASMTRFDNAFTWEETDALREVKTREAFLKNYGRMFTAVIKSKIATLKPVKTDEGYYFAWHTKDLEYSPIAAFMPETNLERYRAVARPGNLSHQQGCRRNVVGVSELVAASSD